MKIIINFKLLFSFFILVAIALIFYNGFFLKKENLEGFSPYYVAYRSGGQVMPLNIDDDACSASYPLQYKNKYVQNTLPAADDAILSGVNALHLNVRRTKDNKIVVFHDSNLGCMTDGNGDVANQDYDSLKSINAGYKLIDTKSEFLWRNNGFTIPLLSDYFKRFPNVRYVINPKVEDEATILLIEKELEALPEDNAKKTFYMGSNKILEIVKKNKLDRRVATISESKKCLVNYLALGWFGYYPDSCKNLIVMVPRSKTKFLWGWPNGFINRVYKNNSELFVWAPGENLDNKDFKYSIITTDLEWVKSNTNN